MCSIAFLFLLIISIAPTSSTNIHRDAKDDLFTKPSKRPEIRSGDSSAMSLPISGEKSRDFPQFVMSLHCLRLQLSRRGPCRTNEVTEKSRREQKKCLVQRCIRLQQQLQQQQQQPQQLQQRVQQQPSHITSNIQSAKIPSPRRIEQVLPVLERKLRSFVTRRSLLASIDETSILAGLRRIRPSSTRGSPDGNPSWDALGVNQITSGRGTGKLGKYGGDTGIAFVASNPTAQLANRDQRFFSPDVGGTVDDSDVVDGNAIGDDDDDGSVDQDGDEDGDEYDSKFLTQLHKENCSHLSVAASSENNPNESKKNKMESGVRREPACEEIDSISIYLRRLQAGQRRIFSTGKRKFPVRSGSEEEARGGEGDKGRRKRGEGEEGEGNAIERKETEKRMHEAKTIQEEPTNELSWSYGVRNSGRPRVLNNSKTTNNSYWKTTVSHVTQSRQRKQRFRNIHQMTQYDVQIAFSQLQLLNDILVRRSAERAAGRRIGDREKIYGRPGETPVSGDYGTTSAVRSPGPGNNRPTTGYKRRINVTRDHCIQSYCAHHTIGIERFQCIMKNCKRSG